jgi:hypothetical protein
MVTPEGATKRKLRKILQGYVGIYTYWPVPSGYGRTTLDVLGCYRGRFFTVETKAPGKKPTLRQQIELESIARAMGETFVIAGEDSPEFGRLRTWLDYLSETVPDAPSIPPDQTNRRAI